ncbi:ATP-binding protein [Streptomyces luteolus]|uniref:ATP-binding protein n=1 Tax=Streptomyces luteolus TaxID=3043615 RepID=UPI0032B7AB0A
MRKHAADADLVRVCLHEQVNGIELTVVNDGHRAAALPPRARGGGFGLDGMRERAAAMAGRLDAGPRDTGGWQVRARLPVRPPGT